MKRKTVIGSVSYGVFISTAPNKCNLVVCPSLTECVQEAARDFMKYSENLEFGVDSWYLVIKSEINELEPVITKKWNVWFSIGWDEDIEYYIDQIFGEESEPELQEIEDIYNYDKVSEVFS